MHTLTKFKAVETTGLFSLPLLPFPFSSVRVLFLSLPPTWLEELVWCCLYSNEKLCTLRSACSKTSDPHIYQPLLWKRCPTSYPRLVSKDDLSLQMGKRELCGASGPGIGLSSRGHERKKTGGRHHHGQVDPEHMTMRTRLWSRSSPGRTQEMIAQVIDREVDKVVQRVDICSALKLLSSL